MTKAGSRKAKRRRESEDEQREARTPTTFFNRRHMLFSKYDEGIRISETMWYSVTPEAVALKIADRIIHFFPEIETAIDLCSGAGGNSIAFARCGFQTIAVDVDPAVHIDAQHNSHVYGVYNIEYVQGSATKVPLSELADPATTIVFSSPEWGGPIYKNQETFDVEVCRPRVSEIIEHAHSQGFNRIVLFLPRTSNLNQLADMGAKYIDYMFQGTWCTAMCAWWC